MKATKLLILSVILCVNIQCRKEKRFEEDPKNSPQTPKQRLVGTWQLQEYTFNGGDIVPQLNAIFSGRHNLGNLKLWYGGNPGEKGLYNMHLSGSGIPFNYSEGVFDDTFISLKTPCSAGLDSAFAMWLITPFHFPIGTTCDTHWKVTKLYKEELNIVLSTDSGDFKMFFDKSK